MRLYCPKIFLTLNIAGVIILLFTGCIKQISLNLRAPTPQLVVEGLLLTDSTPCKVTLSYSGIFNSVGGQVQNFINDATVFVKDGTGDSTQLYNVGSGVYQSASSVNAKVGGSYSLSIALSNGKRYISVPETIVPVPQNVSLDSIGSAVYIPSGPGSGNALNAAVINIKTQDPADQKNYYRWITTDWIPRKATGIQGPACANTGQMTCFQTCFQSFEDMNIYILSDANVNGSEIRNQTVITSPYFDYGNHYINVKQLSLTAQAFEFWELYQQQTTRTGGILDPLPASLVGNIYNVNDSTDVGLGYFECSDVASFKFIFSPEFINAYNTLANTQFYIDQGACYLVYAPAVTNPPPGWETAPRYIVDIY